MKKYQSQNKGITLIALVITIIVLLILAGTVIASLTGENGLLKRAQDAAKDNELGKIRDEILLAWNSIQVDAKVNGWNNEQKRGPLETELKRQAGDEADSVEVKFAEPIFTIKYKGYQTTLNANDGTIGDFIPVTDNTGEINWEEIMRTATKHPNQTKSNDIGIDAKGNIVNLDLWEYRVFGDEAYLECEFTGCGDFAPCYLPLYDEPLEELNISGLDLYNIVCPQYIKKEGKNYVPVVSVACLAEYSGDWGQENWDVHCGYKDKISMEWWTGVSNGISERGKLIESIVLPDTLEIMPSFEGYTSLKKINIPSSVTSFFDAKSIYQNADYSFGNETSLEEIYIQCNYSALSEDLDIWRSRKC